MPSPGASSRPGWGGTPWGEGAGGQQVSCLSLAGYWSVTVFGRKHCYRLYTEHLNEAVHWVCAVQKVIDSKAPVQTPTQLLMRDIEEHCGSPEVLEQIYRCNPILRYTSSPLYAPLLPFPYGSLDQSGSLSSSSERAFLPWAEVPYQRRAQLPQSHPGPGHVVEWRLSPPKGLQRQCGRAASAEECSGCVCSQCDDSTAAGQR
ncbi:PREDICTED: pleckstrin homology domain-containing family H member 3 [Pygoscelis adeliae]|uniref:pleckstrin homology domain-containing family H member 3 n=1 Tax=Pygoscelis adeliae TaxID=9238 RepID=UPI0004F4E0E8|nr:PREDICTED: pleckstrin homology domain-containing family H member 3 [Pygoscelis adeliae]